LNRLDRLAAANGQSTSSKIADLLADAVESAEIQMKLATDPVVAPAMMRAMMQPEILGAIANALRGDLTAEQMQTFEKAMGAASDVIEDQGQMVNVKKRIRRNARSTK
jgi:hypothetical protein